jgi:hypothetical protein
MAAAAPAVPALIATLVLIGISPGRELLLPAAPRKFVEVADENTMKIQTAVCSMTKTPKSDVGSLEFLLVGHGVSSCWSRHNTGGESQVKGTLWGGGLGWGLACYVLRVALHAEA